MTLSKEEQYKRMSKRGQWDWDQWKVWHQLQIRQKIAQEMIAECLGTFLLVTLGNGSVAQSVLSRETKGQFLSINFAYAMGVTMAILLVGNISGAHINPAVSIALSVAGKLPLYKLPAYIFAQLLGAFLSGPIVYSVYFDALYNFADGKLHVSGVNGTAGIFATYPSSFLTSGNGFWDQVFATALLVALVFAITDEKNNKVAPGIQALLIGFVVLVIGLSFGFNCGYAINPARDFGPRLFTLFVWGTEVFTAGTKEGTSWWWVPILAPIIGGLIGALLYKVLINIQIEQRQNAVVKSSKYQEQVNFSNMDGNNSSLRSPEPPTKL